MSVWALALPSLAEASLAGVLARGSGEADAGAFDGSSVLAGIGLACSAALPPPCGTSIRSTVVSVTTPLVAPPA